MTTFEKSIESKVLEAINSNNFTDSGENYSENRIMVWGSGNWETTCLNEYGSRYGSMKSGNIKLTEDEKAYIEDIPWKHISIEY